MVEENQASPEEGMAQSPTEPSPRGNGESTTTTQSPESAVASSDSPQAPKQLVGTTFEEPQILKKQRAKKKVAEAKPTPEDLKWYVVNAYSGFEMKVKKALEERIRTMGLEDYFGEVRVPEETVVELVRGQKKTSTRKFFPGYVLVQMLLNRDTWHLVKETPKVTGFIGDEKDPAPLSQDEVDRILQQVEEGASSPKAKMSFQDGETVKVVDGPFTDFNGTVEEVRPEKGKVKVLISIFGRATPVELDFIQIEKV